VHRQKLAAENGEFRLTSQDAKFLRSMKISVEEK